MILNTINAIILATKIGIEKVGYMPLLTNKMLSEIPSKSRGRNKRRVLRKNAI
jgi:hypothetical protein